MHLPVREECQGESHSDNSTLTSGAVCLLSLRDHGHDNLGCLSVCPGRQGLLLSLSVTPHSALEFNGHVQLMVLLRISISHSINTDGRTHARAHRLHTDYTQTDKQTQIEILGEACDGLTLKENSSQMFWYLFHQSNVDIVRKCFACQVMKFSRYTTFKMQKYSRYEQIP